MIWAEVKDTPFDFFRRNVRPSAVLAGKRSNPVGRHDPARELESGASGWSQLNG
jgi:hypothetical protein